MRIHVLILAALLAGLGCKQKQAAQSATPRTLTVFAAASLTESFRDLSSDFQAKHPGVSVTFNFAGSQQLREQLANGAPADVFASANMKEMDAARTGALVAADAPQVFAHNRLVVIYPKSNTAHMAVFADLGKSGLRLDVADASVPVGKYTIQMLEKAAKDAALGSDFKDKVLANVVSREENVKSVVTKVRLGEADAGIVYVTDVTGEAMKDIAAMDVPDQYNQTADYPIAVAAHAQQPDLAREFVAFVLSADGQRTLRVYGFLPASPTTQP